MQGKDSNLGTTLSFRQDAAVDDFDPVSQTRESVSYPPLEEPLSETAELAMYDKEGAILTVQEEVAGALPAGQTV